MHGQLEAAAGRPAVRDEGRIRLAQMDEECGEELCHVIRPLRSFPAGPVLNAMWHGEAETAVPAGTGGREKAGRRERPAFHGGQRMLNGGR